MTDDENIDQSYKDICTGYRLLIEEMRGGINEQNMLAMRRRQQVADLQADLANAQAEIKHLSDQRSLPPERRL